VDDATVVSSASADFFCEKLTSPDSRLIWHQSSLANEALEPECEGIELRNLGSKLERVISYSHVAITIPRDDPHYGMDGYYPVCLAYEAEPEKLQMCMHDDENTVYAENNYRDEEGFYEGKLVRRTSFNPDFAAMIGDIRCFVDRSC